MSDGRMVVRLLRDDDILAQTPIAVPDDAIVHSVGVQASYSIDGQARTAVAELAPWKSAEEIASYVQGDGSDPVRLALADGIRQGRRTS